MDDKLTHIWDKQDNISLFLIDITKRFNQFEIALNSFADLISTAPEKSIQKYSTALTSENEKLTELNYDLTEIMMVSSQDQNSKLAFPRELILDYQSAYSSALSACDAANEKLLAHKKVLQQLAEELPDEQVIQ